MGCDGRESGSRRVGRRRVGGCFAAVAALALCVCGPAWAVAPLAPAGESGVLAPRAPIAARSAPGRVPHAKHRAQSALPLHLPLPLLAVPTPGGTWSPLGPAAIGPSYNFGGGFYGGENSGRITGLASLPSGAHAGRVVAATAGGGIWTSDDNGAHWTSRTDTAVTQAMGAVAVDPANNEHLVAGTGEANNCQDCYPGSGILVSNDGGQTWSLQNPGGVFNGVSVAQIAIDPTNSNHEFAATTSGLFVTSDGGTTWAKPSDPSYTPFNGNISAVVIDSKTPANVYIGGGPKGVGKSTDGGVHWATANSGITVAGNRTALAIAPSSTSTLYASVGNSPVVLYKSTDGAKTWTATAAPDYTQDEFAYGIGEGTFDQGFYDNVVEVDPTNAEHVIAAGIAIVASTDGGKTWTNVNGKPFKEGGGTNVIHPDFHALAFRSDGKVWVGCDGGVYLYTPSSGAVANGNGNLDITQFYAGFSVVNTKLLAGAQDNSSAVTNSLVLGSWTGLWSGDGAASVITPNEPETQFIQADKGLAVTNNAFGSGKGITPPVGKGNEGNFSIPVAVAPNTVTPNEPTVFYGASDLWRTPNPSAGSPTWTKVTSVGAGVSAIAVSPSNSQVVYVGFDNGVIQVSTDGGKTFTALTKQPTSENWVTGISVNPLNEKEIVASFSVGATRSRLGNPNVAEFSYTSTPGTGTWSVITGDLPEFAVSRVIYDEGALVAATDNGVYATGEANGASTHWHRVGIGMPNVQVQDLDVVPSGLYVITHGRGAWKLVSLGASKLTYTGPSNADYHDPFTASATLTDKSGNSLSGREVTFTLGPNPGESCSAATNGSGEASCSLTPSQTPGSGYTIVAEFAGDGQYNSSSDSKPFTINKEESTLTYTGTTSSDYHDAFTASAILREDSSGPLLAGRLVTFTLGPNPGESCSATTNGSGEASCSLTPNQVPGSGYTILADFAGDAEYLSSSDSKPFTINKEESTLTYTGPTTKDYHDVFTASAILREDSSGPLLAGRSVTFTLGVGDTCSATTNGAGEASCPIKPTQVGPLNIVASFAGDAYYLPSSATKAFSVTPEETTMTYTGPTLILAGSGGATLTANMVEDGANDNDGDGGSSAPFPSQVVTLSIGSQSCMGTTDASGNVSCTIPSVTVPLGPETVGASFGGDAYYAASSAQKQAIVFAFPPYGAFALGDKTVAAATPSTSVTWYWDTWRQPNVLSGGGAPDEFQGFIKNITLPTTTPPTQCDSAWTTPRYVTASQVPLHSIPSYMGTIVTSSVKRVASTIYGNTVGIVIVKTDPGAYKNPPLRGTGTIVATFC